MAIVRVVKDKNFITMGKYHLKEKDMSLKAIGLLSIMLSLPDDWDYSIKGLVKIRKESYDAIRTTLKELEQFGYLKRTQILDKGKFVDVEYTIYEKPILENPITEKPITENPTQYNTNIIEEINNKKEIYKESWDCKIYVEKLTDGVVSYLNDKSERNFRINNPKTESLIRARLKEGFREIDFLQVIEKKCKDWLDTDMEKYLRPETLFGNKFENYVNERRRK